MFFKFHLAQTPSSGADRAPNWNARCLKCRMPATPIKTTSRIDQLRRFALAFWPAPVQVNARERWRVVVGVAFGMLVCALVSQLWAAPGSSLWLAAPLGASAVLVFAVPASPLAQPWAVIGGNTLSALVGAACARWIGEPALAAAIAVALAMALMFVCRCVHPPGGATALLAALSGASFQFALFPMLADSLLLVAAGVVFNGLTGRSYPQVQRRAAGTPAETSRFSAADLDAALAHYNRVLDVSREDLQGLLQHAEAAAYQRNFGDLLCRDVMSKPVVAVQFGTPLQEAWRLMRERRIKALPVIDKASRLVGIVTVADFMRHADLDGHEGLAQRLRSLIRRSGTTHSSKPEVVGQIMMREVRVVSEERPLAGLVPLFSRGGHHHIPVIDAEKRLVGVITQSDLVQSLYRAVSPEAPT